MLKLLLDQQLQIMIFSIIKFHDLNKFGLSALNTVLYFFSLDLGIDLMIGNFTFEFFFINLITIKKKI